MRIAEPNLPKHSACPERSRTGSRVRSPSLRNQRSMTAEMRPSAVVGRASTPLPAPDVQPPGHKVGTHYNSRIAASSQNTKMQTADRGRERQPRTNLLNIIFCFCARNCNYNRSTTKGHRGLTDINRRRFAVSFRNYSVILKTRNYQTKSSRFPYFEPPKHLFRRPVPARLRLRRFG